MCPLQNPQADHCRLQEVGTYCQESRRLDQWVPELVLHERWRVRHPNTPTNTGALSGFRYRWTEGSVAAHAGMAWSGLRRAIPTHEKQESQTPIQGLVNTVVEETGFKNLCCKRHKKKERSTFSSRPTGFLIISKTKCNLLFDIHLFMRCDSNQ